MSAGRGSSQVPEVGGSTPEGSWVEKTQAPGLSSRVMVTLCARRLYRRCRSRLAGASVRAHQIPGCGRKQPGDMDQVAGGLGRAAAITLPGLTLQPPVYDDSGGARDQREDQLLAGVDAYRDWW